MPKKEIKLDVSTEEAQPKDFFEVEDEVYGKRLFVRNGGTYVEVTKDRIVPIRTERARTYKVADLASFIAYVLKYGKPEKGIIFYTHEAITMFFDESSREEQVSIHLSKSLELQALLGKEGLRIFPQKDLIKTFDMYSDMIAEYLKLMPVITSVKADLAIVFEADADPDNYRCLYQEKAGKQTAEIPKKLTLSIPYFEGSQQNTEIVADFEVIVPKNADEKLAFKLSDPRAQRTAKEALQAEIDGLKTELKDWMFIYGS